MNPKDPRVHGERLAAKRAGLAVHPGRLTVQSESLAEDSKGLVFLDPTVFMRRVRRPAVTGG